MRFSRFISVLLLSLLLLGPSTEAYASAVSGGSSCPSPSFSEEALAAVALDGSWHKLLSRVPNPVYVLMMWASITGITVQGLPGQVVRDPGSAWRPYIAQEAATLMQSPDLLKQRIGRALTQPLVIQVEGENALAALHMTRDASGNFVVDPTTRLMKFELGINPNLLDAIAVVRMRVSPADRALLDQYLLSLVVKEIGGLIYVQGHPQIGPFQYQLFLWINDVIQRFAGRTGMVNLTLDQLRDPQLVEPVEHGVGLAIGFEEAGYEDQFNFFSQQGMSADVMDGLASRVAAISPKIAQILQGDARVMRYIAVHPSDRFWALSMHYLHPFIINRGQSSGTDAVSQIYRLGYVIAGVAANAPSVNGVHVIALDPKTQMPPATYMAYLRDRRYVLPSAEEMQRIAPRAQRGMLQSPPGILHPAKWMRPLDLRKSA